MAKIKWHFFSGHGVYHLQVNLYRFSACDVTCYECQRFLFNYVYSMSRVKVFLKYWTKLFLKFYPYKCLNGSCFAFP